ncbi:MAG TPA: GNAT family N-acetyltransferase [Marmoricola sp.]|nr:GNAT family N-acetyltransferase [Marmoricola sp.]
MSESLRIREVGPDDWPHVRDLRLAMLAETSWSFGGGDGAVRALDEARWRERQGTSTAWHAVSDVGVVGSLSVTPDTRTVAELHSLWVARAWRRRGVATRLLEVAIQCWRERDGGGLMLWVDVTSEPAKALYERHGFRASAEIRCEAGLAQERYVQTM